MQVRKSIAALLLLLAAFSPLTDAQTCRPDRLDGGPCCFPAQPDIPFLRSFNQISLDICWRDCDIENVQPCRVRWIFPPFASTGTPPNPCDPQFGRLRFTDSAGTVKWRGTVVAQYSRTWDEVDFAGNQLQVWRYLVNGDLRPTSAAGPSPCPVPPSAAAHGRVRFTGYLDLAEDCATGAQSRAWMLNHGCDFIDHAPGFPRSGAFAPDRSYTFVGPAAGFVPSPLTPIAGGGSPFDSMRTVLPPLASPVPGLGSTCLFEEQIQTFLNPLFQECLCGTPTATPQFQISDLGVSSACGSMVTTPGGPFLPGYISMGIGMWTDPTRYPGPEFLRWNAGGYDYADGCTGITDQEVFFGVTTIDGFPASKTDIFGTPIPLPPIFIDQSNSVRNGATVMNIPYLSTHFLALNF